MTVAMRLVEGIGSVRLHHIGIVTKNVSGCIKLYESFGYSNTKLVYDPMQMASIALMNRTGEPMIELIGPEQERSPAHQWLQRIKAGTYHICYEVPSLGSAIRFMRERGFAPVLDPVPAIAFDNRQVAFVWSPLTGLVELVESVRE